MRQALFSVLPKPHNYSFRKPQISPVSPVCSAELRLPAVLLWARVSARVNSEVNLLSFHVQEGDLPLMNR